MKNNKLILLDDIHLEGRDKEDFSSFFSIIEKEIVKIRDEGYHPIVVCAGDIAEGVDGVKWASKFNTDVIYVCGNHEFWSHDYYEVIDDIENFIKVNNYQHIHFLHNNTKIIGNTKFIGSTLWTDLGKTYPWFNKNYIIRYYVTMGDFKRIKAEKWYTKNNIEKLTLFLKNNGVESHRIDELIKEKSFNPLIQLEENDISKKFIKNELEKEFEGNTVVVTHHLPSINIWFKVKEVSLELISGENINKEKNFYDGIKGNNKDFKEILMSGFYANNLNDFILDTKPSYWLHGHLHSPINELIGHTKVISSPVGYKKQSSELKYKLIDIENNNNFVKKYILSEIKSFDWNIYTNNLKELEQIITNFQAAIISGLILPGDFMPILNKYKQSHLLNIDIIDKAITYWLSLILKNYNNFDYDEEDSFLIKKKVGILDFKSKNIKKESDNVFKSLSPINIFIDKDSFVNNYKKTDRENYHYSEWIKEIAKLQIQYSVYKQIFIEFINKL